MKKWIVLIFIFAQSTAFASTYRVNLGQIMVLQSWVGTIARGLEKFDYYCMPPDIASIIPSYLNGKINFAEAKESLIHKNLHIQKYKYGFPSFENYKKENYSISYLEAVDVSPRKASCNIFDRGWGKSLVYWTATFEEIRSPALELLNLNNLDQEQMKEISTIQKEVTQENSFGLVHVTSLSGSTIGVCLVYNYFFISKENTLYQKYNIEDYFDGSFIVLDKRKYPPSLGFCPSLSRISGVANPIHARIW
ncbi:MAG: hypothetical protein AB8E15_03655 [Bdellovibrionales bacterium]